MWQPMRHLLRQYPATYASGGGGRIRMSCHQLSLDLANHKYWFQTEKPVWQKQARSIQTWYYCAKDNEWRVRHTWGRK